MARFPAMPLWTDALIADTSDLTTAEFGAYVRLLIAAWRSPDCALPDDNVRLARMAGDHKNWHRLRPRVMAFFTLGADGRWRQKRLTAERERLTRKAAAAASAGRASARKREAGSAAHGRAKPLMGNETAPTVAATNGATTAPSSREPSNPLTGKETASTGAQHAEPGNARSNLSAREARNPLENNETGSTIHIHIDSVSGTNTESSTETPSETERGGAHAHASARVIPLPLLTPPRPDPLDAAFDAYNAMAKRIGLPLCQVRDERRRKALRARLKEVGGITGWHMALAKVEASDFCRGANNRGWKADIEFLLRRRTITRLMEGFYDNRTKPQGYDPVEALDRLLGTIGEDNTDEHRNRLAASRD